MTVLAPPLRRRGEVLVEAIHAAVMTELATRGYDAMTIEGVAERAQTGKASIYRRWPTKLELVLDTVDAHMPSIGAVPDTGNVRDDLLVILRRIAKHMNSKAGSAVRNCMTDLKTNVNLATAVRERLVVPRKRVLIDILNRGVERGEVRADAITDRVVELGPMLLYAERAQLGTALRDTTVVAIVDEILMPLLRPTVDPDRPRPPR
ncbi:MAG TPA: TetR/AcrR family transcriptional regulator [Mycobacteriales bacterium]|nr:TetR/AcrR family transcriptional regulator [Mycobacteriales bacterium]